ncbi:MAG: hypothetical protein LH468_07410 [Nocardioides sp.]|nr:hypothetical protein [Nocardioides sp.]
MRWQRTLVLVVMTVMSVLSAYLVVATRFAYGRVLFNVGGTHGLHLSDIPVLGLWGVGMVAAGALWRRPTE